MQAKITGMAINPRGHRTVTLRFRGLDSDGKLRVFDSAYNETVTIREDELSLAGVALGDVVNVEFTAAANAVTQAIIDRDIAQMEKGAPRE